MYIFFILFFLHFSLIAGGIRAVREALSSAVQRQKQRLCVHAQEPVPHRQAGADAAGMYIIILVEKSAGIFIVEC